MVRVICFNVGFYLGLVRSRQKYLAELNLRQDFQPRFNSRQDYV
jgi:hypothetical protein